MAAHDPEKGKAPEITVDEKASGSTTAAPWVAPPKSAPARWWVRTLKLLRALAVLLIIGVPLAIPIIVLREDALIVGVADHGELVRNLVYYIFCALVATWITAWVSFGFACWLPFVFRFFARYVNPAHQRYWRVVRIARLPITFSLTCIAAWMFYIGFLWGNPLCVSVSTSNDPDDWGTDIINLLFYASLWTAFYVVEKAVLGYICVHYHYHSDLTRIVRSKAMHSALCALYNVSLQLHPCGTPIFEHGDHLIGTAVGNDKGLRRATGSYLRRIGIDTYKMISMFGSVVSAGDHHGVKSHWFRPAQTYAIVERALGDEASATALATRIWRSMVLTDETMLTKNDLIEVLGPFRKEEAEGHFTALDSNRLDGLTLDDMISNVTAMAKQRHAIYAGMANFNHIINTFDWVSLGIFTFVVVFLLVAQYVTLLMDIVKLSGKLLMGLSFALGRTVHHFLSGSIFVLFDHAYDVGDRVEIWNTAATSSQSLTVTRISLLYTVFKRCDNGVELQVANEALATVRIENLSRGGVQKGSIKVTVDIGTTFQDLCALRAELEAFVKANPRDYGDKIGLGIAGLNALDSMDIKCGYAHVGDFSDEKASGQRNARFMCAFVTAVRKVGIKRPHGQVGDQGRPMYTVTMDKESADVKLGLPSYTSPVDEATGERIPAEDAEAAAIDKLVKLPTVLAKKDDTAEASGAVVHDMAGLRFKVNPGTQSLFHR